MPEGRESVKRALALSYEGRPTALLEYCIDRCDAVEILPDCMLDGGSRTISTRHAAEVLEVADGRPLVAHGIGLSIGTVSEWNHDYFETIESTLDALPLRWFSEHLGYTTVDGHFLGCMPAVPRTNQFIDLIAHRARLLRDRFGIEIVFEHVASPIDSGGTMSLAAFLNDVATASGCGLILDLHNLECDADNGRLDLVSFFEEFNSLHVREIHLAGGIWRDGLHLDVHARPTAPSTLAMFQNVLALCPNVELVVFELLAQAVPLLGFDCVAGELDSIRAIMTAESEMELI